jgi:HAD superfamily hydrolase (TIGR01490 family)
MVNLEVPPSKAAAIFDFDGTLFTGHFWTGLIKHHFKQGTRRLSVVAYCATHYPLWFVYKLKLLTEDQAKIKWGEDLPVLLKGFTIDQLVDIYRWIEENYVTRLYRSDMLQLLNKHKEKGHVIIILSGSFTGFLEMIKGKLGIDHVVGTRLKMEENICTGTIEKPLCFGKAKAMYLRQYIETSGLHIDFDGSYAYGDSMTDLPVLEMVGHPVAAYADTRLRYLALRRGWSVFPESH